MAAKPGAHLGVLVDGIVVEDGMDDLARRDLRLDGVEEPDELLMPVALHAATDDLALEHVEGGEQGGRAVALVVVGHGPSAALLQWKARLGAVQSLDLGLLVDRQDDGVGRRVDVEADDVSDLGGDCGSLESLNWRTRCGCRPCERQMRCTELTLTPVSLAIASAVQCVVSPGGSLRVSATTRSATSAPSGGIREGRVLSRRRPSTPSCMNRSCQRHTAVLLTPAVRMIWAVPTPSAVNSTIRARQTCFWGLFRSAKIAPSRRRSAGLTSVEMPVRIP
jgi:hypothetical protein